MFKLTITLQNEAEVEDVLAALSEAENQGMLDFPFNIETHEVTRRELIEDLGFRLKK